MTITVAKQSDLTYALICESHGFKSVAGPRLFRGPPHPDIRFSGHASIEEAEKDAEFLRQYLAGLPEKKTSRKKLRAYRD